MADEVIYRGYNEEIDVNMVPGGPMSVWHSSQYDELRKLRVNLYNGKSLQYLGSGVTVSLSVRKTDGNIIESSDPDVIKIVTENPWGEGSAPWRFIEINTTQQMTACVGKNVCEIVVYQTVSGETSRVGSANFILEVERDPLAGGIQSDSEIDDLQTMVEEALEDCSLGSLGDVLFTNLSSGDIIVRDGIRWVNKKRYYDHEVTLNEGVTSFEVTDSHIKSSSIIQVFRPNFTDKGPANVTIDTSGTDPKVVVTLQQEASLFEKWKVRIVN